MSYMNDKVTKIVAVWYPTKVGRPGRHEVHEVVDVNTIKNVFADLLFYKHANNLVVNYDNKMYMIEPVDKEKMLYKRREIKYHPLAAQAMVLAMS